MAASIFDLSPGASSVWKNQIFFSEEIFSSANFRKDGVSSKFLVLTIIFIVFEIF